MEISGEVPAKKSKRLTSIVWDHFERVRKADMQYAVCLHCNKKLSGSTNSGTTHLRNHLVRCLKRSNFDVSQLLSGKSKRKENIIGPGVIGQSNLGLPVINNDEGKIKDDVMYPKIIKFDQEQKKEETNQATISYGSVKFDQERSRLDLARMIMLHGYPLSMVDHVGFKIFVKNLQPMFEVNSDGAIELECVSLYEKEKQKVSEIIRHLHSRINLAVDMWGSSDGSEYVCLTANYIDENWRLQKKMLNFISLGPSRTDDMLSDVIIKCLTDWGIDRKLFSMTFDDCSDYEIMVYRIRNWLSQSRPLLRNGELFDVRCVSHLMKSIVQEVIETCHDMIHRVRESVKHVKSTQAILGKFKEIAEQLGINAERRLVLDCPGQWNSLYLMLESAVDYRGAFLLLLEHDSTYSMVLSEAEWEWAISVVGYLKYFLEFTHVFGGNKYPTTNIYFPEICDMHIQLIDWCKSSDDFLSAVAMNMKKKFDVYWNKCSLSLAIAAILDPRFKMKLVEYYYRQIYGSNATAQIREISNGLRQLFDEYAMGSTLFDQDSAPHGSSQPSTSHSTRDKLKGFDKFLYETSQSQNTASDLDKYLEEPVFPRNNDFSILNWWKVHTPRYPILSMMARDVLAIPVSTIGPEVAFNNIGRVLDEYHSSLSPETREALMCGQDWLKVEPEAAIPISSISPLPLAMEMN